MHTKPKRPAKPTITLSARFTHAEIEAIKAACAALTPPAKPATLIRWLTVRWAQTQK